MESQQDWTTPAALSAFAGMSVLFLIWWWYFDGAGGAREQPVRSTRDSLRFHLWSYAHFPLSLGIIVTGVGVQRVVSAASHSTLSQNEWIILLSAAATVAIALTVVGATSGVRHRLLPASDANRRTVIVSAVVALLCIGGGRAHAQERLDVGLLLGSTRATDEGTALQFDRGTTWQATVAWPLRRGDRVKVSIEVPFIASPAFTIVPSRATLPLEYASLYLTPGIRVAVTPRSHVSFFGALGAGYARYSESRLTGNRSANPNQRDTNAAALQVGGGVDIRGLRWLGFRGEARDIYTGARQFSVATPGPRVHNVVVSGGLVIRF